MSACNKNSESIAIVGWACRFPGGSNSPAKLWDLLRQPRDVLSPLSREDRFNQDGFYHPNGSHHGTSHVKQSYLLEEDPRVFDANFFGIKPVEAHVMDPQQRILLETVYESLESGGFSIQQMSGSQTAVYVGQMWADYDVHVLRDVDAMPTYAGIGTARSILSNRVSHFFDWHGPSVTLDTACSSSLVAVYNAALTLQNGDASAAVVAGANLILTPEPYIGMSNLTMISPDSRSRMWDVDVKGYARGEGVAALVLKRLSDAVRDGDNIQGVIRGVGVNQDGRTKEGITMPSVHAQSALIRETYAKAGLDVRNKADRCQYFEAHGTGTGAGDPREAEAIATTFFGPSFQDHDTSNVLYVGSVKTVIGHTEGTAGIAGIMKACLALQNGEIPPNMFFNTLNPKIAPFYHNLEVPTEVRKWPALPPATPRRASVNSFGFGGTNAHVILENYVPSEEYSTIVREKQATCLLPIVFSAFSSPSLKATIRKYVEHLGRNPSIGLRDLAYTLSSHRSVLPVRAAFAASSVPELARKLDSWLQDTDKKADTITIRPTNLTSKRILGVFTGQGAQWATMGRELLSSFPRVRAIIAELEQALQSLPVADRPNWSIAEELSSEEQHSRLSEAAISQPLCTAVQIVLVDLLRAAGINFKAVVGHSSGEIGAAYAASFLTARDAIRIAYYRGVVTRLAGNAGSPGAMMAVGTSYEDAQDLCALDILQGGVRVAAVNSSSSVTLSGDADAIAHARLILEDEKKFARLLRVDKAYHSHHMIPCSEPYTQCMRQCQIAIQPGGNKDTAWFSSVYPNTRMSVSDALGDQYWADNMEKPVLFSQAIQCATEQAGPFDAIIEIGPHPALKGPALQTITECSGKATSVLYTGLLSRQSNDITSFSAGLGALWEALGSGVVKFDMLDQFVTDSSPRKLQTGLPSYSWDHNQVYWHESRRIRAYRSRKYSPHDLLGSPTVDGVQGELRWSGLLRLSEIPWVRGHSLQGQVVFPATGYVATALEAARSFAGGREVKLLEVNDFVIHRAMAIDETHDIETLVTLSLQHEDDEIAVATFQYHASVQRDTTDLTLLASSSLNLYFENTGSSSLALTQREAPPPNLIEVDAEDFYDYLGEVGYNYTGSFRGLKCMKRKLDYGMGSFAITEEEWGGPLPMMAPSFLDLALQSIFISFGWPRDGSLLDVHVPVHIGSVKIDVPSWTAVSATQPHVDFVSQLRKTPASMNCDVSLFCPTTNTPVVQIENITVVPLSADSNAMTREIFTKTTYWPLGVGPEGFTTKFVPDSEQQFGWDLERVSLFYMRQLEKAFPPERRFKLAEPHHQFLFEFTEDAFSRLRQGLLPFVKTEWLSDTQEDINAILDKYSDKVDIQLLRIVGENMGAAMRGETDILQHMFQGDTMDRWYVESLGFDRLMEWLGEMTNHISRIYPRMDILELGAGTGAATKSILKHIGDRFASYTYTDISASFFEKAASNFPSLRMRFKTLDLEKDLSDQGYTPGSYDLVVASNVLHATRELDKSLQTARSLLKPGGFLLICEITTHNVLHVRLPFSCLSGWWLGREDGRRLSATIDTLEWNERLLRTGFSGLDAISDEANTLVLKSNIMVSQAVDDRVQLLRAPLLSSPPKTAVDTNSQLVIIGGQSVESASLAGQLARLLNRQASRPVWVRRLEDLPNMTLSRTCSVIQLGDLDEAALECMTEQRLRGLKTLFEHPRTILWVTRGCREDHPLQNMSVGLGRVLMVEMPTGRLQFLDFADGINADSTRHIAETYMRWMMLAECGPDLESGALLWTSERELVYRDGIYTVPRIAFDLELNRRYMASRKLITQKLCPSEASLVLQRSDGVWSFAESVSSPLTVPSLPISTIKVTLSSATACYGGLYAILGTEADTSEPVAALSSTNGSRIISPAAMQPLDNILLQKGLAVTASSLAAELQAFSILDHVPSGSIVILEQPSLPLAEAVHRLGAKRLSEVILLSDTKQRADPDLPWTVIPRQATARSVMSTLPKLKSASLFINCTESLSPCRKSLLDRVLPRSCWKATLQELVARKSPRAADPSTLLFEVLTNLSRAIERWPSDTDSAMISKSPSSLDLLHDPDNATSLMIDWSASPPVPAIVQPIDSYISFSPNKTYILFGLTSDLGLSIAEWLVAHGARHVALTSRSPKIDEAWLPLMQNAGVEMKVFASDITSEEALREVVAEIRNTMPPIGGIANGAMVLMDSTFSDTSLDQTLRILAPKVQGTTYLDSIFGSEKLDFFILFSSVACLSGNQAQGIYSAANMFMTALAANRRKRGLVASVMHIGAIFGVGYMSRTSGGSVNRNLLDALWASGADWLSERDLQNAFGEAVLAGRPELGRNPEFSFGFRSLKIGRDTAIVMANPRFSHLLVDDSVVAKMTAVLQLDSNKPEAEILAAAPEDLGADSLVTVELRNWFAGELRVDVPILKLLGGNTVEELVEFAIANLSAELIPNMDPENTDGVNTDPPKPHLASAPLSGTDSALAQLDTHIPPLESDSSISSSDDDIGRSESKPILEGIENSAWKPAMSQVVRSVPISLGQSRFWFLHHYLKDTTALNVSFMARLAGSIDTGALASAVEKVASLHEALRTSFSATDGVATQSVLAKSPLTLELQTISDEAEAYRALASIKAHNYDLERGETMRMLLLTLASSSTLHYLVIGYHHINMDGISLEVLLSDIQKAYDGEQLSTPIQYPDFSIRQHKEVSQGVMAQEVAYWTRELTNAPPTLPLLPFAAVTSRPTLDAYVFESASTDLSPSVGNAIRKITKNTKTSMFHFFLAVYGVLLRRYAGTQEVCIGMTDAGRDFGQYAKSIGFYLNLLPIRLRIEQGDTLEKVLALTRSKTQKAMANSRLPFNQILKAATAELADTHNPLFQAAINYRPGVNTQRTYCGCEGQSEDIDVGATAHDLMLDIVENPGAKISLRLNVQRALYSQKDAQTLMGSYVALLTEFSREPRANVDAPSLYGMSVEEVQQTIQIGRGPERASSWPDTLVHRIDAIAHQQPNAVALTDGRGSAMTYRGMERRIRAITAAMAEVNGFRKDPVGVYCEPSSDSVCAMLAVMRNGVAYLPLDPRAPLQRLVTMATSAGVRLILTDHTTAKMAQELKTQVPGLVTLTVSEMAHVVSPEAASAPLVKVRASDTAVVLFTSGTTGTPKGIELPHSALLNSIEAASASYGPASACVLQQTSMSFDACLFQVLFALSCGGKLVILPQDQRLDPAAAAATIRDEEVTFTLATPSEYKAWLQYGREALEKSPAWQMAAQGGEMYSLRVAEELRSLRLPHLQLLNMYGPGEASIYCSQDTMHVENESMCTQTGQPPPVGRPLPNVSIYVLDHENQLAPRGAAGQVFIGGAGVARGYIQNVELTNSKFVPDPFASPFAVSQGWTRMYATGDRGRFHADGTLTILGRIEGDTQVKIRGMRTELEEIERAILETADGLLDQVVVTTRGESASLFLVAHGTLSPISAAAGHSVEEVATRLQQVLSRLALPSWMRPAVIVPLERLPLNLHGKVDRRDIASLPVAPSVGKAGSGDSKVSLTGPQQKMMQVWEHVLGPGGIFTATPSPTTEFFRVGGTSLQLIQIQSELQQRFGVRIPVVELFKNNTLDAMSAVVFGDETGGVNKNQRLEIDWDQETSLPEIHMDIRSGKAAVQPRHPPQVVLLTGATGFVGQAILSALIANDQVQTIHCLAVREPSKFGSLQHHPKLIIHRGDLAHNSLSLMPEEQQHLAQTVEMIIHNGADVSFLKPYTSLRQPNVLSTRFLVALAAPRRIPIHYISSASVGRLLLQGNQDGDTRFHATSLAHTPPAAQWADGYTASKWASETLLERAANSHLAVPVVIHRLSSVTPNSSASSGGEHPSQATDVVGSMVHYSCNLRAVPDPKMVRWRGALDFVSVGRVADGVVSSAFSRKQEIEGISRPKAHGIDPPIRFLFQSSEQIVPVERIREYVARRLGIQDSEVRVLPMDKWLALARQAGMEELVAVFLEESQRRADREGLVFQELLSS
ncbi:PKS-NRPS hybrid [Thozetella sp. PMI_491]|nr:PKS-NRPS hybrid [Thozetella sp. PMI_491]